MGSCMLMQILKSHWSPRLSVTLGILTRLERPTNSLRSAKGVVVKTAEIESNDSITHCKLLIKAITTASLTLRNGKKASFKICKTKKSKTSPASSTCSPNLVKITLARTIKYRMGRIRWRRRAWDGINCLRYKTSKENHCLIFVIVWSYSVTLSKRI